MRKTESHSKSSNYIDTVSNLNYEFSPPSSPSSLQNNHNNYNNYNNNHHQSKTRLGFSSQEQLLPANTLNHDEWWLLANQQQKEKIKRKPKNKETETKMTQNELKEHLKVK